MQRKLNSRGPTDGGVIDVLASRLIPGLIESAKNGDKEAAKALLSIAKEYLQAGLRHGLNEILKDDVVLVDYFIQSIGEIENNKPVDRAFHLKGKKGRDPRVNADRDRNIWILVRGRMKEGHTLESACFEVEHFLQEKYHYQLSDSTIKKIYLRLERETFGTNN